MLAAVAAIAEAQIQPMREMVALAAVPQEQAIAVVQVIVLLTLAVGLVAAKILAVMAAPVL